MSNEILEAAIAHYIGWYRLSDEETHQLKLPFGIWCASDGSFCMSPPNWCGSLDACLEDCWPHLYSRGFGLSMNVGYDRATYVYVYVYKHMIRADTRADTEEDLARAFCEAFLEVCERLETVVAKGGDYD